MGCLVDRIIICHLEEYSLGGNSNRYSSEVVQFPRMKGAVENWLNELVRFMQETLTEVLDASMTATAAWDLDKPREELVFTVPAQIAVMTSQIIWTENVNLLLRSSKLVTRMR